MKLKKHQQNVVDFLARHRGVICVHSTGSGKTLTAVGVICHYLTTHKSAKIMFICPVSLMQNIRKEYLAYVGQEIPDQVKIISFASFIRLPRLPVIDMLIIDEAHNLRNSEGEIYGRVKQLAEKVSKIMMLTATPFVNSVDDVMSLVRLAFPNAKSIPRNLFSYYELKSNNSNFPEVKINIQNFIMPPEYEKTYIAIEEDEKAKLKNRLSGDDRDVFITEKNLKVFYNGVRRASNTLPNNPKIKWVCDMIMSAAVPNHKMIVFSNFIDSGIRVVQNCADSKRIKYVKIDGESTVGDRTQSIAEYNNNKIPLILISRAGCEGLDLKGTHTVILMEPGWNDSQATQVIGRAARYKSHVDYRHKTVHVYRCFLMSKNTMSVDEYLRDLCAKKTQEMQRVLRKIRSVCIEKNNLEGNIIANKV